MRRLLFLLLSICVLGSAMGINPGSRNCRMAKSGKSSECPCSPKDNKKKCCQKKLKPQKHLAQKNQGKHINSERFALPLSPIVSPFLYFLGGLKENRTRTLSFYEKPPDSNPPSYIFHQNFRC